MYFYAGSLQGANNYVNKGFKWKSDEQWVKKALELHHYYRHTNGTDESYLLIDLDGKDVNEVKWMVSRFSPLVNSSEATNLQPHNGIVFAQHAPHSKKNNLSQSMIDYWGKNVGKDKTVDLDKFTCPCCGKKTKREDIDGAHVKIEGKTGQFITPSCKDCNEYTVVTERYFKVKEVDVVKAP